MLRADTSSATTRLIVFPVVRFVALLCVDSPCYSARGSRCELPLPRCCVILSYKKKGVCVSNECVAQVVKSLILRIVDSLSC